MAVCSFCDREREYVVVSLGAVICQSCTVKVVTEFARMRAITRAMPDAAEATGHRSMFAREV